MPYASAFIDPVVRRACVVEDRTWRGGIEIVSHVNYDQLARVRVALGVMPDACGRSLTPELLAGARRQGMAGEQRLSPAATEGHRPLVLWTDIMAQVVRRDTTGSAMSPGQATPDRHFGPALYHDEVEPLRRSA